MLNSHSMIACLRAGKIGILEGWKMYEDGPKSEGSGGINECRRPRGGITAQVSPININGENGIAYELDSIVYTDQSVMLKVLEGKLDKLTGEWKNWLARNTE